MRLTGFLAFTLLSISILSYGASDVVFATSDPNPALPISTDIEIVSNGASVTISGNIQDYESSSGKGLTFLVMSPDNAIVQIGQLTSNQISSDGSFTKSFVAGGTYWKTNGDYTIEFHYGADTSKVTIDYVGGEHQLLPHQNTSCYHTRTPVVTTPEHQLLPHQNTSCYHTRTPVVTTPEHQLLPHQNTSCYHTRTPVVTTPEPPVVTEPSVPEPTEPEPVICGAGTEPDVNGICIVSQPQCPEGYTMKDGLCVENGGGCLIATAAYGTELAPQVQLLREIRDNTLFSTTSGTSFMIGFNTIYYSFAPTVADWERESPMFKEIVKTMITPMLSTLSIMSLADEGSEVEVLGLGISVIVLNLGMYIAAPALIGFKVNQIVKSRK